MREIKFRVWDKEEDVMYQNGSFILEVLGKFVSVYVKAKPYIRELIDYKLMQYTGLKDKNGKEIYEGDIVKVYTSYSDDVLLIGEVKYGEFAYSSCDEYYCTRYGHYVDVKWEDYQSNTGYPIQDGSIIEVVGNIYENEDLL